MENRETFFGRLDVRLAPREVLDIELAYTLAKSAHRWQIRKSLGPDGRPQRYFEHLRRTALILMDVAGVYERDLVVAALLHDGVEDTRELGLKIIEHAFGTVVARIVRKLTKAPKDGYVERLRQAGWRTLLIKACDRLDNLRTLDEPGVEPEFKDKQLSETREKYADLFERLDELAPARYRSGVAAVIGEIRRLAGIC